ncbi:MAG TPA: NADAR family protein [Gammaproteobacteria bacterium]|nr:NADAR family protein [Gammaproteobacteria bacterium]
MTAIRGFNGRYRFLSNFYPSRIVLGFEWDNVFPTVEHAFQASKLINAADREMVRRATSPSEAKRLGRTLPMRQDWDHVKVDTMYSLLRKKFQIPVLRQKLLATGDAELYETNTWGDRFWGVDPQGIGANVLGNQLVMLREEIKEFILNS